MRHNRCHPDIHTAAQSPAEWLDSRRSHLTASNFGAVCRMRETTSLAKKVWRLLYNKIKDNNATRYGTESEYQTEAEYIEHQTDGLSNIVIEHLGLEPIHRWPFLPSFAWWCCPMQPSNTTREVSSWIQKSSKPHPKAALCSAGSHRERCWVSRNTKQHFTLM